MLINLIYNTKYEKIKLIEELKMIYDTNKYNL